MKQQEYSNKNHQWLDILIKLEQQIHIKFSMGILHNIVYATGELPKSYILTLCRIYLDK